MSIYVNKYALITEKPNEIQTHRYGSHNERFMQEDIYLLACMMEQLVEWLKKE